MNPLHIIVWMGAPSFRYVICKRSVSRGVTVYQMISGASYEFEADAQRHINTLASRETMHTKESLISVSTPPVSGTTGVSGK